MICAPSSNHGGGHKQPLFGFTLLEVLVALAILSLVLTTALGALGSSTDQAARVVDQTMAHWVALNKIVELQTTSTWPPPARQRGVQRQGGRQWYWFARVFKTGEADVRRLEIEVRAVEDGAPLITQIFKGPPSSARISRRRRWWKRTFERRT